MTDEQALGRWPIRRDTPVAWGDMDALQHVNNTVYMRWFETGRMAYFEEVGMLDDIDQTGVGPILASCTIHYRLPVTYPDDVHIEATILRVGRTSFVMGNRVFSKEHGAICAEGEAVIVMVNYATGQKVPLSDALKAAVHRLESTGTKSD